MVFEKVKKVLADHLDKNEDEITMETSFEELGVDSLDMMQMVMEMEDELGITIELEQGIKTVGELVSFIESK